MEEVAVEKRVYIGGFAQTVTADEVRDRFKPFGQVQTVDIPASVADTATRRFGFVSINIKPSQWLRCVKVYTGAKWKGGELCVKEAKEDYTTRLRREREETEEDTEDISAPSKKARNTRTDGIHADDMAVVTTKNIARYSGWTKNRYGQPVLKYAQIKPNGKSFTYDPATHKNSYQRLSGEASTKSLGELQWEYDAELSKADFGLAKKLSSAMVTQMNKTRRDLDQIKNNISVPFAEVELSDSESELDGEFDSDSENDILDMMAAGKFTEAGSIPAFMPFEDGKEVASLLASASATIDPEHQAKLVNHVFDSSSEDEDEVPGQTLRNASDKTLTFKKPKQKVNYAMTAEEIELAEERKRTAAILNQMLRAEDVNSSPQDGSTNKAGSGKPTKQASSSSNSSGSSSSSTSSEADTGESSSTGSGSSSSSSSSNNTSSSSSSSDSSDDDSDDDSSKDDSDADSTDEDDSSDESSDSDSSSSSDDEDKSNSDGNSSSNAMDVDENPPNNPGGLFGGSEEQSKSGSSGLFSSPQSGSFMFTQMLGLEADEASAMMQTAENEEFTGPVTGGSQTIGSARRNLNANRLPLFFPDLDSPSFRKPETVFHRQKTEEELEQELDDIRSERVKEYKAQQRSTQRRARKLQEQHPGGTAN
ncbi:hypothetical protein COEREDRAFT_82206, partial [Coemansia reversa NRRL 1564]